MKGTTEALENCFVVEALTVIVLDFCGSTLLVAEGDEPNLRTLALSIGCAVLA